MINLVIKDFKANVKNLLNYLSMHILIGSISYLFYKDGNYFVIHCSLITLIAIWGLTYVETVGKNSVITCCLPVNRSRIVKARYLTSFILTCAGTVNFIVLPMILKSVFPEFAVRADSVFSTGSYVKYLMTIVLFVSFFLPVVFRFKVTYAVIFASFVIFAVVSIIVYELGNNMFLSLMSYSEPSFSGISAVQFIVIVSILSLMLVISISLSVKFYLTKDL